MNLATLIDPHPGAAPALISDGERTDYGTLRDQVARLRGGLASLGLEAGDRLAVDCTNNGACVVSYLAGLGAGLVVVPVNPQSPARELGRQLAAVGARAVVAGPTSLDALNGVDAEQVPALEHRVAFGPTDLPGSIPLDDLLASEPGPVTQRDADDLALLMFTSGTAGAPRAAMLTHGNLLANLEQSDEHFGDLLGPDDVALGVLPLFHIFGLNVVLGGALYTGSSVLLVERFDPASTLEAIEEHGITLVSGPPNMWSSLVEAPEASPSAMATVRVAASGAAKLPVAVAERVEERFGVRLTEGYGLTETSPIVATSAGTSAPLGSVGVPIPGVEVRLVDADGDDRLVGDDVLVGDIGEIWVRGPNVFVGYWDDPQATDDALTPDGWLRTGDLAVVDDAGFLYLVDRAKDLIIVSGFNVYPGEVEEALLEHPGVEAVAVVGAEHPRTGETVVAHVVTADGHTLEQDQLVDWARGQLPRYKCPTRIELIAELPTGLAGKVRRRALRG